MQTDEAELFMPSRRDSLRHCGNIAPTLEAHMGTGGNNVPVTLWPTGDTAMRKITQTECERLQGFPDGHTDAPFNGRKAPEAARYKCLGNSMSVNCMAWIGERIVATELDIT